LRRGLRLRYFQSSGARVDTEREIRGEKVNEQVFRETFVASVKKSAQKAAIEPVPKRAITNHRVLNEAYHYSKPSSFSRGMRVDLGGGAVMLLISGTASIDEHGATVHVGDFRAQCRRTFQNITALLASEGATWKDIVRTTCYLRDIDRDYAQFNEERTAFYNQQGLDPLPASTGVQAKLCRPELLVEIESIAMFREVPEE
jgi:2-iminobutanoate/2-iminopropanoate deaminase